MRQQVNLVKTLPKQEYEWLSLSRMKKVCLVFAVLLIIIYLFSLWQNYNLGHEFKSVQAREKAQLENVKALVAKHPKEEIDAEIQNQVSKLEAQLSSNQKILALLKTSRTLNLVGFSQYLQALIATIPHNAWLTGIDITEAGEHVALFGKAYDSHTVLSFVDNLNQNELFSGLKLRFRLVKVKRAAVIDSASEEDSAPIYDFSITTSEDDEKAR